MATLAPLLLFLLPLLILPGVLFYYDVTPKIAVLLFATSTGLLFFNENARALRALLATQCGGQFATLLGCQQVSLILATVFSSGPALSFAGSNWRRYGLIQQSALALIALLLAGHFTVNPRALRRCLQATALAGCIAAAYGILQYFGWDPLLPAESYHVGDGEFKIVRPPATFGHAGFFSTYLLCTLFAGINLSRTDPWLSRCTFVLSPIAILLSGTRAALLGLLAGLVVLSLLKRPALRTIAIATALCIVSLGVLMLTPAGGRLKARVHWASEDALGGARLLLWRDSLRMSVSHWAVGTGLETFGNSFPVWQSKELARQYPDFYHESPHNLFLDALTAQGVLGLLVWLGLCALPLIFIRRDPALGAGLVAVVVSLQFTSLTVATAAGLLFLAAALVRGQDEPTRVEINRRWRVSSGVVAGALALAGLFTVVTDQRLQAMKAALDAGRPDDAAAAYRQADRWALPGGNADVYYSRRMAALGRWPEAIEAARRAVRVAEDKQNALYSLATIQAATKDSAGVEASLKGAIDAAPNWFKPHWMLAQVLASQGRVDEAEHEAALALDLSASRFPEVAETIGKIRRAR